MNQGWVPLAIKLLVKNFNGYVIILDWGDISNCTYEQNVAEIVPSVAQYTADVIKLFNFNPNKIELVGHRSLIF